MKGKIFAVIIAIAIIAIPMLSAPISADDGQSVKKIGDKVIVSKDIVATYQGKTAQGREIYKATIDAPKYQEDLVTPISTEWADRSNGKFVGTGNLIYAEVNGSQVELLYKGNNMVWTPALSVGNKVLAASNPVLLSKDPINANYNRNTLEWEYGSGIVRHLRQIEGVVMDLYIFDKAPDGDIVITEQTTKSVGYKYDTKAYAYDADGKPIKLTVSVNTKTVKLADLAGVKYPIIIDPTNNYVTSASDGYTYHNGAFGEAYATIQSTATGDGAVAAGQDFLIGQYWYNAGSKAYNIWRSYVYFDTSDLPDVANVTAATLSLYGETDSSTGNFDITIQSGMPTYPHDPLVTSDYDYSKYSSDGGHLTSVGWSVAGYNAITLNATGLGWVNTTGVTKFALRSSQDIAAVANVSDEERVYAWAYEKGAGFRPKLDVTYTVIVPTVTTAAASVVVCTSATLNGSIDNLGGDLVTKQGFVWDTATHAEPGSGTAPAASAYASNDMHTDAGGYAVGNYTHDLAGLTEGQIYYARFVGYNSAGYKYANEINFTCWKDPTASTAAATTITTTTARLQAYIDDDGGDAGAVTVRWGYGTTDQGVNIAAYDTVTAYTGTWSTGQNPYLDVGPLVAATTYYFNVQAQNDCGTDVGVSRTFDTETSVGSPSNASAIPSYNSVTVSWVKGAGATLTVVKFLANSCPANEVAGTLAYSGTASSFTHTGLTPGTDYCYYIVGYDVTEGYSATAITIHATTLAGAATGSTFAASPTQPTGWNADPNATAIAAHNPFAPYIAGIATSTAVPVNNLWFFIAMVITTVVAYATYKLTHHAVPVVIATMICMAIGTATGIIPMYLTAIIVIIAGGAILLQLRSNV